MARHPVLISALFFVSAPVCWLGLVFLWLFWYKLGIAAGTGYYSPAQYGAFTWLNHMLLPWLTLALLYAGWYARMTRGSVLDTLDQDFVRTARGKGLPESRVLTRHVLRASLTPVLTMFGMDLAALASGTVIVEVVFNLNGVGQWAVQAVTSDDIPSVLAVTLVAALAVMLANLAVLAQIDLWRTSHVFLAGHRIRLEVSSSAFPKYDRNLNTGGPLATGTEMTVAANSVWHTGGYPSHLILPEIPARD